MNTSSHNIPMYKRGDLVLSGEHSGELRGPYVVAFRLNSGLLVCVSLDANSSVNLSEAKARPFLLADGAFELIQDRMNERHFSS